MYIYYKKGSGGTELLWISYRMPAYNASSFFAVFFVIFILINTYIFMSVFLAVVYNNYKKYLKVTSSSSASTSLPPPSSSEVDLYDRKITSITANSSIPTGNRPI